MEIITAPMSQSYYKAQKEMMHIRESVKCKALHKHELLLLDVEFTSIEKIQAFSLAKGGSL